MLAGFEKDLHLAVRVGAMLVKVRNAGFDFPGVIAILVPVAVFGVGVWFLAPQIDAWERFSGICINDADIRDCAREGFRRLYTQVQNAAGATPEQMAAFFAVGMLCNVTTALQLDEVDEPWAKALKNLDAVFPLC